ncbi:hypothetical protein Q5E55_003775 [Acinetobacter baumannii]|nr:hypothetical protein [Acinetobacter baumannii]
MNFIIKQNEVSSVLNKNGSSFIKNEPLFINQLCTRQISQNPYPIRILLS